MPVIIIHPFYFISFFLSLRLHEGDTLVKEIWFIIPIMQLDRAISEDRKVITHVSFELKDVVRQNGDKFEDALH
jgi:hypothetical protein